MCKGPLYCIAPKRKTLKTSKFLAVITTHKTDALFFVLPDSIVIAVGNLEKGVEHLK